MQIVYNICKGEQNLCKTSKSDFKEDVNPTFRPKNYHIHLKNEHPIRWEKYHSLSKESKLIYLDIEIYFMNLFVKVCNFVQIIWCTLLQLENLICSLISQDICD